MKLVLGAFLIVVSINSFAGGFIGKIGPFKPYEYSEKELAISKCMNNVGKINLNADSLYSRKHTFPRFSYTDISIELKSGKVILLVSESPTSKYKELTIAIPKNDCINKIKVNAISSGSTLGGRSKDIYIDVWTSK